MYLIQKVNQSLFDPEIRFLTIQNLAMTKEALVSSNVRLFKCRKFALLLPLFAFLMAFSLHVTANNLFVRDIRGKLTNRNGEALAGVSVSVKGTNQGTTTNVQGEFVLNGVPDNATIVFSYVGYQPQEIKLTAGRTVFNIELEEEAKAMEDVVVTGFQRINKKNFTGASVRLRAEDVKMDGVADVSRMLEGRAAGVSVQNVSGTFGAAPKVRVRGATSINGDNKPLWVIDGVVQEDIINISNEQLSSGDPTTLLGSAVAGLNVNDIESFDILKDAAAAALYGARAMNGVVVITTKKGRVGKTNVTYIGNFSTQLKPELQRIQHHELC
jgi:TonB-dependent SusC/RagA subfamily outer membrane receptor